MWIFRIYRSFCLSLYFTQCASVFGSGDVFSQVIRDLPLLLKESPTQQDTTKWLIFTRYKQTWSCFLSCQMKDAYKRQKRTAGARALCRDHRFKECEIEMEPPLDGAKRSDMLFQMLRTDALMKADTMRCYQEGGFNTQIHPSIYPLALVLVPTPLVFPIFELLMKLCAG